MSDLTPEQKESIYVHQVYNEIAEHFSQTRYKPWPIVDKYLTEQKPGSVGLDVGCGNGKYLKINESLFIIGSDRSSELIKIAHKEKEGAQVVVADALDLPFRPETFDFAISIAVIHHFSSPERRIQALRRILETLTKEGTALIYCWALEQKSSRRGWDEGMDQDVFVPWVTKKVKNTTPEAPKTEETSVKQRYYHLYRKDELENEVRSAGGVVLDHGYERDNWWVIMSN